MAKKSVLIGYDLNKPREHDDYKDLIEKIKKVGDTWWHCLDSTWIIKTNTSCKEIRDALIPLIDDGDELLVVDLTGTGAWTGFKGNCSTWLKNNL